MRTIRGWSVSVLALMAALTASTAAAAAASGWSVCYLPEDANDVTGWASVALGFDAERRAAPAGSPTAAATLRILPVPVTGPDYVAAHIRAVSANADCDAFIGPSDSEATDAVRPLTRGRPMVSPGLGVVPTRGNASDGYVRVAHTEDEVVRVGLRGVFPTFVLRRVAAVAADTDVGAQLLAAAEEKAGLVSPKIGLTSTFVASAAAAAAFVRGVDTPGVLVLLRPGTPLFEALTHEVVATGSHREHVYVFVGAWCVDPTANPFPGALCVDHTLDPAGSAGLVAEAAARNDTFIAGVLAAAGVPAADVAQLAASLATTSAAAQVALSTYALRRDAMAVLFAALRAADSSAPPATSALETRRAAAAAALPRVDINGASGPLSFTATGARVAGTLDIVNVLGPNSNATAFAVVDVLSKNFSFVTPRPLLNWFNRTFALEPPADALINSTSLHMCYIYQSMFIASQSALHGIFMAQYYADRFPINFRVTPIADQAGSTTLAGIASAVAEHRDDCDMYLGPVTSFVSTSVTALIDKPWISETASSTELSDEDAHPWFSRVIPNDGQGGAAIADLLLHFGYKKIAILCTDEPYGRTVAEGVTTAFLAGGGNVAYRECMPTIASNATIDAGLDAVESEARVLVLATVVSVPTHFGIVDRILARGAERRMVLVFDEPYEGFEAIEGSFAIAVTQDRSLSADYMSQFVPWVQQEDHLTMITDAAPALSYESFSPWSALMHDAVFFAMTAISEHARVHGLDPAPAALQQVLRNATPVAGFTGNVSLSPTGERVGAFYTYVNSAGGQAVPFGRWVDTTGVERDESQPLSWLGGSVVSSDAPAVYDTGKASAFDVPPHIVAVALCIGILITVICFSVYKLRQLSPEAFGRAISSGTLFHAAKITFHFADLAADLTACYTVVSDDAITFTIKAFFAVLTGVAVVASVTELVMLFQALTRSLRGVVLTIDEDAKQQRRLEYGTLLTMCLEDIPMAVISLYIVIASSGPPEWVLTVTLTVSAFGSGMKASTVGPLLWHVWVSRSYENGRLGDEATREPLSAKLKLNLIDVLEGVEVSENISVKTAEPEAEAAVDDWTPCVSPNDEQLFPVRDMTHPNANRSHIKDVTVVVLVPQAAGADSPGPRLPTDEELRARCETVLARLKDDPIDIESSQARIDFFAVFLEILLPQRYQLIKRAAERTAKALVSDNVSQNEFYAVLLPYLAVLFDRAESGDGDDDGDGALVHFSAVEAMDVRREAQALSVRHRPGDDDGTLSAGSKLNPLSMAVPIDFADQPAPSSSTFASGRSATHPIPVKGGVSKMVRAAMQRQRADLDAMVSLSDLPAQPQQSQVRVGGKATAAKVSSTSRSSQRSPPRPLDASASRNASFAMLAQRWGHPSAGSRRRQRQPDAPTSASAPPSMDLGSLVSSQEPKLPAYPANTNNKRNQNDNTTCEENTAGREP